MRVFKVGLALMIYCLAASLAVGIVRSVTRERIERIAYEQKMSAIKEVLPTALEFKLVQLQKGLSYYIGVSGNDTIGYVVEASGYGFSSYIVAMVGLDRNLTIERIKVVSHTETPGLGSKVEDSWFGEQFSGKSLQQLKVDKDGGSIKAITGATISSRALTNAIKQAIIELKGRIH